MAKNMTDLSRQYDQLVSMADKLQSLSSLSPSTMQMLAGILARISMLELQLYGESNIYCRSRRKGQKQAEDAPF